MDKRIFNLSPKAPCPIEELTDVTVLRLPLGERTPVKTLKKRFAVAQGVCIATHPSPNVGNMHAPFDAVVKDLTDTFIELERAPLPKAAPKEGGEAGEAAEAKPAAGAEFAVPAAPVSFEGMNALELGKILKELGVAIRPFTRPCDLFIINAINPEPGMLYAEEMLDKHLAVIEAGLWLIRVLNEASEFVLALPQGSPHRLEGTTPRFVRPQYPIALARPLIRQITGKEDTQRVTLTRIHNVFLLGLVAMSGLPLTRTVITAFGKNYLAPLGTPVAYFLEKAGISPKEGDSVVLGGAMRGVAISGVRRGIRKVDDAMQFVPRGSRAELGDNPCINCGACVSACPMRLRPNMLSRYAEFERYEACRKESIETCIECGMCGWICPACRPMQQQFRMIKNVLGLSTFQHRLRS